MILEQPWREGPKCTFLPETARRDQFAPFRIQHSARGLDCKIGKNLGGELRFAKNWKLASSSSRRCSARSRVFRIFAQLEEESCRTQNTKHVRKRSRINPEVESKRTARYGERKVWQFWISGGKGCRPKFFQSRPNWTPRTRRNHQDTSRIKAQKPNCAEIRSSPRIYRGSPLEKTRPARQKLLGKKTFQKREN